MELLIPIRAEVLTELPCRRNTVARDVRFDPNQCDASFFLLCFEEGRDEKWTAEVWTKIRTEIGKPNIFFVRTFHSARDRVLLQSMAESERDRRASRDVPTLYRALEGSVVLLQVRNGTSVAVACEKNASG